MASLASIIRTAEMWQQTPKRMWQRNKREKPTLKEMVKFLDQDRATTGLYVLPKEALKEENLGQHLLHLERIDKGAGTVQLANHSGDQQHLVMNSEFLQSHCIFYPREGDYTDTTKLEDFRKGGNKFFRDQAIKHRHRRLVREYFGRMAEDVDFTGAIGSGIEVRSVPRLRTGLVLGAAAVAVVAAYAVHAVSSDPQAYERSKMFPKDEAGYEAIISREEERLNMATTVANTTLAYRQQRLAAAEQAINQAEHPIYYLLPGDPHYDERKVDLKHYRVIHRGETQGSIKGDRLLTLIAEDPSLSASAQYGGGVPREKPLYEYTFPANVAMGVPLEAGDPNNIQVRVVVQYPLQAKFFDLIRAIQIVYDQSGAKAGILADLELVHGFKTH